MVDNMEQTFPVLLGLDGLAAAKGITNHINSVVTFRDDTGVDQQYPFEPVVPQNPVLPASVSGVAAATSGGLKRRSTKKRPARLVLQTATVWSSALCLLLTAVVQANLATTPTGFFSVDVGPPKNDAVTFDTVAANATKVVFDASFEQTVEWHDPYLDPDIPSPFSDWSPDLPPQSTVGGFTSLFTNDAGPVDSLPSRRSC